MKKSATIFLCFLVITKFFSQGITNITISPAMPTENDTVLITVSQIYNSSSCPLHSQSVNINNFQITSSSLHCLGMLQTLCNNVDTFLIMPLSAGIYSYTHSMNSGFGFPDCTAGIIPDDIDSIQFEVISSGLKVIESLNSNVKISPNPTNANIQIVFKEYNGPFNVEIYDLQGKWLGNYSSNIISLSNYKKGVYILRVYYGERMESFKIINR
tara:strand:+ start:80 stop:718 length:639 start_codon:yes stop_codon:yes gene_type:complete